MVLSQNSEDRPEGPRCQPKAGTLTCVGRRLTYMLVLYNGDKPNLMKDSKLN